MQVKCLIGTYMYEGKLYRKNKVYVVSDEVGMDLVNKVNSFGQRYFESVSNGDSSMPPASVSAGKQEAPKKRGRKPANKKKVGTKKKVGNKKKDGAVDESPIDVSKNKIKQDSDLSNPTAPMNQLPGDMDEDEDSEAVEV